MPSLGASFGRGGATTFLQDLQNSDCIVIQGSNMAECHPVGFQWVMEAKKRGARVIHIDPRFTRTSALADQHVPIRAGSDIAFLGGIVNHILSNDAYFDEYVRAYTNATFLVRDDFQDAEELDGLFSGYDEASASYDQTSWRYAGGEDDDGDPAGNTGHAHGEAHGSGGPTIDPRDIRTDPTMQHPRCVLQVLKRHYARYTPEIVAEVCGVPVEDFRKVCEAVVANSGRERTTCWVYSVGWTQHSTAIQYIRGSAIIQLLLGNMGRPGGGILALRGHASIQGSTDIPTLFNLLPGYLPMPKAADHETFDDYLAGIRDPHQKGFWGNADAYIISLMRAWYGEAATESSNWGLDFVPRISGDHGTYQTVLDMLDDKVEGYFLLGQNPAVGSAHGRLQRLGMAHLRWLVVRDLNMIESATFWKDGPEIETGELETTKIPTEVFFLPAASHVEKSGTFTQTQRLLQWHHKAVEPPGDCQSELDFFHVLGQKLKARYADSADPKDRAVQAVTWDYEKDAAGEIGDAVLREISGYGPDGLVSGYLDLKADGSTASGCWIYSGVYADGVNQSARRKPGQEQDWVAKEWGWAWPYNRRQLYNRASADPDGKPWSERKAYMQWDGEHWVGPDNVDFVKDRPPSYRADEGATGPAALNGDDPFVMQADGKGWLFAPSGLVDGPLPTHYEPAESPVDNALYRQQGNPTREVFRRKENPMQPSGSEPGADVFPYVFTTYRLTEHHTAGGMSRWLPYLSELQPEFFCEVSPAHAKERGLEHLGWATIVTARTAIEARVLVTDRVRPLQVAGRTIHQVGLPYHWGVGSDAVVSGDAANDLLGLALDPNVHIQESKVAACDIRPGRRPRGTALLRLVEEYRSRAGITVETGQQRLTPKGTAP
ncbi:MAG: molybdopterin-dependent oxidoreductase [Frankiales bacterium]|nr:molybdopterin-dependent oxidoreductase [Frankiales bacterium]